MAQDLIIQLICILPLIQILVYILGGILLKRLAKYTHDFWFMCWLIPRHIKRPDCEQSKYYNRFPIKKGQYWNLSQAIDDPFLIELADNINKKIGNKSDGYKARYILKLVQFGYTYRRDVKTYGDAERWAFPVCTSLLHIGDCEDGQLLGAGLSKLCGLDVVMVSLYGHAMYAVKVNGFGMKVEHNGEKYLLCETTSILPIGISLTEAKILATYEVEEPPQDYIDKYTIYDEFSKYPLN